jgi:hypothetical protein
LQHFLRAYWIVRVVGSWACGDSKHSLRSYGPDSKRWRSGSKRSSAMNRIARANHFWIGLARARLPKSERGKQQYANKQLGFHCRLQQ